jgi:hypothetical protein
MLPAFAILLLSAYAPAYGDTTVDCAPYASVLADFQNQLEVQSLGSAANSTYATFAGDLNPSYEIVAQFASSFGIPPECFRELAGKLKVEFLARIEAATPHGTRTFADPVVGLEYSLRYWSLWNWSGTACANSGLGGFTQYTTSGMRVGAPAPSWCNQNSDKWGNFGNFLNRPAGVVYAELAATDTFRTAGLTLETVTILQAYDRMIRANSDSDMAVVLASYRSQLSTAAKYRLVSILLQQELYAYDNARANAGTDGMTVVDGAQIRAALRHNAAFGNLLGTSGDNTVAGICRDHAALGAIVLRDLGVTESYVMTYRLSTGGHSIVLSQDPDQKTVLHRLDYGAEYLSAGVDGAQALYMGPADTTLEYRVANPAKNYVASIPSAMGLHLSELSGGDPSRLLEPLARPRGSVIAGNLLPGGLDDRFQARIFVSQDAVGSVYAGAAADVTYGDTKADPTAAANTGRLGVVMGTKYSGSGVIPSNGQSFDFIYAQLEHQLRTRSVELGTPELQARIEAMAGAYFIVGRTRSPNPDDGMVNADFDMRAQVGVRVNQNMSNLDDWIKRFAATYYAGVQFDPIGVADQRADYWPQVPIPYFTRLVLSAEGRYRLSQTLEGRAYLLAATTVIVDYFGVRGRAEIGLALNRFAATLGIRGRLANDSPVFEEGSIRAIEGSLVYRPTKYMNFGVRGFSNLESDMGLPPAMGIGGQFSVRY